MELLDKISDANGWILTVTGLATVFLTLSAIYLFLVIYSKIMKLSGKKQKSGVTTNDLSGKTVLSSDLEEEVIEAGQTLEGPENDNKHTDLNQQQRLDDTLPKMAAAAAVSVFLKMRKKRILALLPKTSDFSPWISTARYQGIHNHPSRNPWNRTK